MLLPLYHDIYHAYTGLPQYSLARALHHTPILSPPHPALLVRTRIVTALILHRTLGIVRSDMDGFLDYNGRVLGWAGFVPSLAMRVHCSTTLPALLTDENHGHSGHLPHATATRGWAALIRRRWTGLYYVTYLFLDAWRHVAHLRFARTHARRLSTDRHAQKTAGRWRALSLRQRHYAPLPHDFATLCRAGTHHQDAQRTLPRTLPNSVHLVPFAYVSRILKRLYHHGSIASIPLQRNDTYMLRHAGRRAAHVRHTRCTSRGVLNGPGRGWGPPRFTQTPARSYSTVDARFLPDFIDHDRRRLTLRYRSHLVAFCYAHLRT